MTSPQGSNQWRSLDFVRDTLISGHRIRIQPGTVPKQISISARCTGWRGSFVSD
jgi:hypothetical protein